MNQQHNDEQHHDEQGKNVTTGPQAAELEALEQELRQMALRMAQALADLDCPDCCGPVHTFIEHGCEVYREEWEWACFVQVVQHRRIRGGGRS